MKPEKLITVAGTIIQEDQRVMLHTSTCQCGKLVVRSNKRTSLNYYTGNEKYNAKCCNAPLRYTGEQLFNGDEIIEPTITITQSQTTEEFTKTNNLSTTAKVEKKKKIVKEKKIAKEQKENMDTFEIIKQIKIQKHMSWVQLQEGCNIILTGQIGRPGAKSFANVVIKTTGLTAIQIIELLLEKVIESKKVMA